MPEKTCGLSTEAMANIEVFAGQYRANIEPSLVIRNHHGPETFHSVPVVVDERVKALTEYLQMQDPGRYHWGRTIFAEVVAFELLEDQFGGDGLAVRYAPTQVDQSVPKPGKEYQKGADFCIGRESKPTNGNRELNPVCAIDVSLGHAPVIRLKRRMPGFQWRAGMPVLVWPLLKLGPGNSIIKYLDYHAREAVFLSGVYEPFYGMADGEINRLQQRIIDTLSEGVEKCRESFESSRASRLQVDQYPHLDSVFDMLTRTDAVFRGQAEHN